MARDRSELIERRKKLARPRIEDFSQLRTGDVLRMRSGFEDTAWFELVVMEIDFTEQDVTTGLATGIGSLVRESPLPFPTDNKSLLAFAEYDASLLNPYTAPTGPLVDAYIRQEDTFISGIPYQLGTNEPLLPAPYNPKHSSYALSLDAWQTEK